MNIYMAILIASVLQFIFGAVWYTYLGKVWGQIHGFDKLPNDVQQKMMKGMAPLYIAQFIVTFISTYVLALLMPDLTPSWSTFVAASLLWLGFIVPTQVSGVIFGGTPNKWIVKKIAIQAGASFFSMQIAAAVLQVFK